MTAELDRIAVEMNNISLRREQLQEERKKLSLLLEFISLTGTGNTEETSSKQHAIDRIDEELKQLSDKRLELQRCHDNILNAQGPKKVTIKTNGKVVPDVSPVSGPFVLYVEAPPTIPAPTVILDKENLPAYPSKTQCPYCRQFITTEIVTSVSSVTWLVCFMTAVMGCVAGCCLIPFCMDRFKSVTHRCPRCRSSIHTIKKL